ncbi:MAG: hypothetical protein JXA50_11260 [Deltaproteobacteria bacterium]|nr:hypothetical protein [Deltaproteobacteria bacterium]
MSKREDELIKEGWQKRFIAEEPRLSEMVHLYKETGFEVHLEPLSAVEKPDEENQECQTCRICFEGTEDKYQVIFTRPQKGNE